MTKMVIDESVASFGGFCKHRNSKDGPECNREWFKDETIAYKKVNGRDIPFCFKCGEALVRQGRAVWSDKKSGGSDDSPQAPAKGMGESITEATGREIIAQLKESNRLQRLLLEHFDVDHEKPTQEQTSFKPPSEAAKDRGELLDYHGKKFQRFAIEQLPPIGSEEEARWKSLAQWTDNNEELYRLFLKAGFKEDAIKGWLMVFRDAHGIEPKAKPDDPKRNDDPDDLFSQPDVIPF